MANQAKKLVIIPGWGLSRISFGPIRVFLQQNGYETYICVAAFSRSQKGKDAIEGELTLLHDRLNQLKLHDFVLIGASLGGFIAQAYTAAHPESLSKLILVDTAGMHSKRSTFKLGMRVVTKSFGALWRKDMRKPAFLMLLDGLNSLLFHPRRLLHSTRAIAHKDSTEYAKRIEIPTQILWSDHDEVLPIEDGRKLHAMIRGSTFALVHGSHDWLHYAPEQLLPFL